MATYKFLVTFDIERRDHAPIRCDHIALALEEVDDIDLNVDVVHVQDLSDVDRSAWRTTHVIHAPLPTPDKST